MQNGTKINGPHQGALIDLDDNDNWAFIHFQDMWAYGRIVHLEPVMWYNDWPICGHVGDPLLAGAPVSEADYPLDVKTNYKIDLMIILKIINYHFYGKHKLIPKILVQF